MFGGIPITKFAEGGPQEQQAGGMDISKLSPEELVQLKQMLMQAQPPGQPQQSPVERAQASYQGQMGGGQQGMFHGMSPEDIEQIIGLGSMDEKGQALDLQMQQAQELARPKSGRHSSVAGTVIGGLGDLLGAGVGAYGQYKTREQQQELLDQKEAARKKYAKGALFGLGGY